MRALIVPPEASHSIAALNSGTRAIVPVLDTQGREVLDADLLTDLVTWADYADILTTLPIEDVELPIRNGAL